MASDYYNISGA
ncbi:hypothetical protein CGLO_18126 [Colletotrichum gloeosporioides Cg-14]|uniref:Uncharacterized protein n=1 Tax=Colletotrichum gloeosporioides (strain Cg-14) TaxID=1237896 RepID=T0JS15_COLGC|nr:hypothetical protein CGLO_18126 [Colletotrichum gloeosporioides Cg-14]